MSKWTLRIQFLLSVCLISISCLFSFLLFSLFPIWFCSSNDSSQQYRTHFQVYQSSCRTLQTISRFSSNAMNEHSKYLSRWKSAQKHFSRRLYSQLWFNSSVWFMCNFVYSAIWMCGHWNLRVIAIHAFQYSQLKCQTIVFLNLCSVHFIPDIPDMSTLNVHQTIFLLRKNSQSNCNYHFPFDQSTQYRTHLMKSTLKHQ